MNIYNPSGSERKFIGIEPFYWFYASGLKIVRLYGDIFRQKLLPDKNYLIISKSEVIHPGKVMVVSDKWDKLPDNKVYPECLKENAWGHVRDNLKYRNQPVRINGKEFIITYPLEKVKLPFLYSRATGTLFLVLSLTYTSNPRLAKIFKVMDQELGDWAKYYSADTKELLWQHLNIVPCGEIAHTGLAEYCISHGYDIKVGQPEIRNISNKRSYMLIKRHLRTEKLVVIPNRWELRGDAHPPWAAWMDEDNSILRMIGYQQYSGCRGLLGGRRCMIVMFPEKIYNPVIWDVDSNQVFTLPSRAYPGDKYYKQIVSHFGEIY